MKLANSKGDIQLHVVTVLDVAKMNICRTVCMFLDCHKKYIMKVNCFFLLMLLFCFSEQTTAEWDICPPWFIPDNTSITGCSCHHYSTNVMCGPDFPFLYLGSCMTYNNTSGATVFGTCSYIRHYNIIDLIISGIYSCQVMYLYLMSLCVGN